MIGRRTALPVQSLGRGRVVKFLNVASAPSARLLAVGLALHLLTACSSIHNQTVAAGGLFVPVPPKAGYATVYIGRPYTFHTSVFALPIHVDDKPLMSLPPGQYTAFELAPGPHSVGSPNECMDPGDFGRTASRESLGRGRQGVLSAAEALGRRCRLLVYDGGLRRAAENRHRSQHLRGSGRRRQRCAAVRSSTN